MMHSTLCFKIAVARLCKMYGGHISRAFALASRSVASMAGLQVWVWVWGFVFWSSKPYSLGKMPYQLTSSR